MGMPNIVTLDSLRLMMPESAMWPPEGPIWGMHDFTNAGAQNAADFRARVQKSYGSASNVADWLWLAQFENYAGPRAMFEAQSKNRMGLLIWMSHSCWAATFPVLVGASRKRFLGHLLAGPDGTPRSFEDCDGATVAITALAATAGAWCVRVHQVPLNADAVRVAAVWRAAAPDATEAADPPLLVTGRP